MAIACKLGKPIAPAALFFFFSFTLDLSPCFEYVYILPTDPLNADYRFGWLLVVDVYCYTYYYTRLRPLDVSS